MEGIKTVGFPVVMCLILVYLVFETIPKQIDKLAANIQQVNAALVANQATLTANQSVVIANQNAMIRSLTALEKLAEKEHR